MKDHRTHSFASTCLLVLAGALCVPLIACDADGGEGYMAFRDRPGDGPGGDVYDGDYVWQPMVEHEAWVTERTTFRDPDADASVFGGDGDGVSITVATTEQWPYSNEPGLRLNLHHNIHSPVETTASEDLLWAAVRFSCEDDDESILVEAYVADGEEIAPGFEVEPNDYFNGAPLRVGLHCMATAVVGESSLGGGGPIYVEAELPDPSRRMYAATDLLVHGSHPSFNEAYMDAAFSSEVFAEILHSEISHAIGGEGFSHYLWAQPWAVRVDGDYRIQADCGGGFTDLHPLNERAWYQNLSIPFEEAYVDYETDSAVFRACDVRIGIFVEGPISPDPDIDVGA